MLKNELVERQKTKDKRRKPKAIKWEYVTKPFDVYVLPSQIKRAHTALTPSLVVPDSGLYFGIPILHLRPCVQGLDEYGAVVKYLYCTRGGRFFVRGKDGWNEILPVNINRHSKSPAYGGGYDCPQLRQHGTKPAHRCVAFAWLDVPEDVKLQLVGVDASTKWEVDHLNTDHKNWTADNLQWVTVEENRRRGKIAKRMRKIGLDPKLLTPTLLRGIYGLPEEHFEAFIGRYLLACEECEDPMETWSIRTCVAIALDNTRRLMNVL